MKIDMALEIASTALDRHRRGLGELSAAVVPVQISPAALATLVAYVQATRAVPGAEGEMEHWDAFFAERAEARKRKGKAA